MTNLLFDKSSGPSSVQSVGRSGDMLWEGGDVLWEGGDVLWEGTQCQVAQASRPF